MERRLRHKICSQCASIKSLAEMLKTCQAEKKPKMLMLIKEAAQDIMDCASRLEKNLET